MFTSFLQLSGHQREGAIHPTARFRSHAP